MRKKPELPEEPGWRDYFQIFTTILMAGLGGYVLWQTLIFKWALPSFIFSIAMLLFALYRIRMIRFYFKQRDKRNGF